MKDKLHVIANAVFFAFVILIIYSATRPASYMAYPGREPIQIDHEVELPLVPDAD